MVGPPLAPIGSISVVRLPGDHDTWSVTVFTATGDQPLKRLRDAASWTRVVAACPLHAPWLEGEPITGILPMSGIMDRYRRFVVDGRPVATGFFAVADAWACTNPSAGRGLTVGFKHAVRLRDILHRGDADPYALAEEFHEITETEIAPWYWSQIADDRTRIAEITAVREGRQPPPPADELAQLIMTCAGSHRWTPTSHGRVSSTSAHSRRYRRSPTGRPARQAHRGQAVDQTTRHLPRYPAQIMRSCSSS
jgi:hypothetical protein